MGWARLPSTQEDAHPHLVFGIVGDSSGWLSSPAVAPPLDGWQAPAGGHRSHSCPVMAPRGSCGATVFLPWEVLGVRVLAVTRPGQPAPSFLCAL